MGAEVALNVRTTLGEGPVWHEASGTLLFVDVLPGDVYRYSPDTGTSTVVNVGQAVGAVVFDPTGTLVVAVRDGIGVIDGNEMRVATPIESENPENRMNDAKCDPQGRLWAGTMAFDATEKAGALYRIGPDFASARIVDGLTISNGMGWTADGQLMYFIDSPTHRIDCFDFDPAEGAIGNRRPFVELDPAEGLPDGMTVDAEGGVWVAFFGGGTVKRYTAAGDHAATVELPVTQVTSCTFGGPDLQDLYVTTASVGLTDDELAAQPLAGSLFRCRPGVRGTPAVPFG